MNKYPALILAIVLTGFLPIAVQALGYTFVSAEYLRFTSDTYGELEDIDGSGLSIDLSIAVRPALAITAKLLHVNNADVIASGAKASVNINSVFLGALVHAPINDVSDFILEVGFISGESNLAGVSKSNEDADGSEVNIGFRTMQSDKLELNAYLYKNKIETKTNIGFSLGAAYYAGESLSIDLDLSFDSDTSLLALGLTKYF